jgi:methylenetetrahydrofolate reductase (NADPH)
VDVDEKQGRLSKAMTAMETHSTERQRALAELLEDYSVELTARDGKSILAVAERLPRDAKVFIANLPNESADVLVKAAIALREAGLVPVPHIVARNIGNRHRLDDMLARLTSEAGVDRALVLGGDRDDPAGEFHDSLHMIRTGLFQRHGINSIAIACYPEGHPRIADEVLDKALCEKLAAAADAKLEVTLVSQFLFDPKPIVTLARRLRASGITAPLRVGVAGPADRTKLFKYALRCGVGASLRALKERRDMAKTVLAGETPGELLSEVAQAQLRDPSLAIEGVHFFTFGDPARSVRWAEDRREMATAPSGVPHKTATGRSIF